MPQQPVGGLEENPHRGAVWLRILDVDEASIGRVGVRPLRAGSVGRFSIC